MRAAEKVLIIAGGIAGMRLAVRRACAKLEGAGAAVLIGAGVTRRSDDIPQTETTDGQFMAA